eukprot:12245491-Ditylum_brightwellii.AAC.1
MDNYLNSQLKKLNNVRAKTKQHAKYKCNPRFGKDSQQPTEDDITPKLDQNVYSPSRRLDTANKPHQSSQITQQRLAL